MQFLVFYWLAYGASHFLFCWFVKCPLVVVVCPYNKDNFKYARRRMHAFSHISFGSLMWINNTNSNISLYRIRQNIQGEKLSRISQCLNHPQKFSQLFYITSLNLYSERIKSIKFSPSKVLPCTVYH